MNKQSKEKSELPGDIFSQSRQHISLNKSQNVGYQQNNRMDIISDKSSQKSNFSNEIFWSDYLNLSFNTKIFSQNSDYIYELGNIYAAKNEIDEGLSGITDEALNDAA